MIDGRTLAVIPVYRDSGNLAKVLNRFDQRIVDAICLVLDCDGESDAQPKDYATPANIPIHIIRNLERKGIGYAIRQGLSYGLENGFKFVVVMAGNNKDNPAEIPRLLEPILTGGFDYVQGSRFISGGKRVKNPLFRRIFSQFYPFLWTLSTGVRCTDVTNGFRAYRLKILLNPKIDICQEWLDGYELEYYIHYKALTLGFKTKEVPVSKVYSHRNKGGYSQISPLRDWWKIVSPLIYLSTGAKN